MSGRLSGTVKFGIVLAAVSTLGGCSQSRSRLPEPRPVATTRPPRPQRPKLPPVQPRSRHAATPAAYGLPQDVLPPSRARRRWDFIVIHHSATRVGGAQLFHRIHTRDKGWDEMGYHFVIGNGTNTADGRVEVGSRWYKQKHGAHCKTPDNRYNDHGIGICLVGDFEKGGQPTRAQMSSLERLVSYLMRHYRVPIRRVTTHGAVTQKTACPGKNFPLAMLKNRLYGRMAALPGAEDDVSVWDTRPVAAGRDVACKQDPRQVLLNWTSDSVDDALNVNVHP